MRRMKAEAERKRAEAERRRKMEAHKEEFWYVVFVYLCLCVFVSLCLCVFVSLCLCVGLWRSLEKVETLDS